MAVQYVPCHEYSTKLFHWDKQRKRFSAEASDIGYTGCSRIYPDACDVGICLKSHRTGKSLWFYLDETIRDPEGDVQAWVFKPSPEAERDGASGLIVTIFND